MEQMELLTLEEAREMAKALMASGRGTPEYSRGLRFLNTAMRLGDPEAEYLIAYLGMKKEIQLSAADKTQDQIVMELLYKSASEGYLPARSLLNSVQRGKARRLGEKNSGAAPDGPLTDFDGRRIRINATGALTPIDAVLSYSDGENVLTLSANLSYYLDDRLEDPNLFHKAVEDGMLEWQGTYVVFGDQKVRVEIHLTHEERLWDNVTVIAAVPSFMQEVKKMSDKIVHDEKKKARTEDIITNNRSFATHGIRKWSVRSRKMIYILSDEEGYKDYANIKDTAKHEFGHALGLGDLYFSEVDNYAGVPGGTYADLDQYHISGKTYNLVMCDHRGPISDNDIEMVILAFANNKMQHYQSNHKNEEISAALGRGN